jgi:hypothetical protein
MSRIGCYDALNLLRCSATCMVWCKYSVGVDTRSDAPTEYEN